MTDVIVYRSADPGVLGAWKDACAAITAYVKATQAVLDAHGLTGRQVWRNTGSSGYGKVRGIGAGESSPPGWRGTAREYLVPDKRTKAGREIDAGLRAIPHPGCPLRRLPGMPADVLPGGAGRLHSPNVRVLGDAIYAEWDLDPEPVGCSFFSDSTEVDHELWERVKLSEYYAARESADEAKVLVAS